MASSGKLDAMEDEDFTGFEEEAAVLKAAEVADKYAGMLREEGVNETDSDSGNLVIAEPQKKAELKSAEKSPRKRKSVVMENSAPTRTPSSRVKGRGLAYLLAMEKGGSKKQLAKAQAQVDAQDTTPGNNDQADSTMEEIEPEPEKVEKKEPVKEVRTPRVTREKELPKTPNTNNSPLPTPKSGKGGSRKSYGSTHISSPLLKEPFKDGWRREVVYRATVDPGTKTLCDVYYYAPDGKKLRSGREVAEYLDKHSSPYTVDNFTFFKEPIGMDPQQEMLRHAKQRREEGGHAQEKSIVKKERQLKIREEELKRNLQELGQDVAAITANAPSEAAEQAAPVDAGGDASSPQRKKKGKPEKQLKIKLWGKGLRSKENAEPLRKEEAAETESGNHVEKSSPSRALPDDISHLFTAHTGAPKGSAPRSVGRNQKSSSIQNLELINGKRFVSICTSPESVDRSPGTAGDEHLGASKRSLGPSAALGSPRASPKRLKMASTAGRASIDLFSPDQFNNFVSQAYHGLLQVFRYLTVQELMAAAGVCKLWRDLALHHSHWRLVRLKNSRIYDWSLFASHLRRAGTQHLDMRKMLFVTSQEETWKNLDLAASNLSEILRIDLCRCPSELLETIAKHCCRLKNIDAQTISSSNIRFGPLSNLTQLEELKIRASSKLTIDDGLEAFAHLKNLKSLSLTTLSGLQASELNHLAGLEKLETLEMGDCSEWTEESHYEILGQLSHLRHLRLEQGPPSASVLNYLTSLNQITSLQDLELINFTVNAPLDQFQLSGLKRLLIVPRYSEETLKETVEHLLAALGSMKNLQQVTWIVTEEILDQVDGKLPLAATNKESPEEKKEEEQHEEEQEKEEQEQSISLEQLQDLLRQRLAQASVRLLRLPEYATHRYSLSMSQED